MACFQESVCVVLIGNRGKEVFVLKGKEGPSGRPFTRIQTSPRGECWFHRPIMGGLFSFLSFFLSLSFFFSLFFFFFFLFSSLFFFQVMHTLDILSKYVKLCSLCAGIWRNE